MRSHRSGGELRLSPILVGAVLGAVLGCTQNEEACDPDTEIEVLYGSDVAGESDTIVCEAAPATCGRQPDCACLEGQELDNGFQLDFCLEEGSCESEDGLVAIVCPGG